MSPRLELRWLDGGSPALEQAVARLHRALLPHSPLAQLGERFLTAYYYRELPRRRLIDVLVGCLEGRAVGFIAVTPDADGFMRKALRQQPVALAWALVKAVAGGPRRIAALLEASAISRSRSEDAAGGGELLTFAVEESARSAQFIRSSGVRVANELMSRAIERLHARGVRRIRSLVDADNKAVRILYGAMGWRLRATSARGWRTPQVEFVHDGSEAP